MISNLSYSQCISQLRRLHENCISTRTISSVDVEVVQNLFKRIVQDQNSCCLGKTDLREYTQRVKELSAVNRFAYRRNTIGLVIKAFFKMQFFQLIPDDTISTKDRISVCNMLFLSIGDQNLQICKKIIDLVIKFPKKERKDLCIILCTFFDRIGFSLQLFVDLLHSIQIEKTQDTLNAILNFSWEHLSEKDFVNLFEVSQNLTTQNNVESLKVVKIIMQFFGGNKKNYPLSLQSQLSFFYSYSNLSDVQKDILGNFSCILPYVKNIEIINRILALILQIPNRDCESFLESLFSVWSRLANNDIREIYFCLFEYFCIDTLDSLHAVIPFDANYDNEILLVSEILFKMPNLQNELYEGILDKIILAKTKEEFLYYVNCINDMQQILFDKQENFIAQYCFFIEEFKQFLPQNINDPIFSFLRNLSKTRSLPLDVSCYHKDKRIIAFSLALEFCKNDLTPFHFTCVLQALLQAENLQIEAFKENISFYLNLSQNTEIVGIVFLMFSMLDSSQIRQIPSIFFAIKNQEGNDISDVDILTLLLIFPKDCLDRFKTALFQLFSQRVFLECWQIAVQHILDLDQELTCKVHNHLYQKLCAISNPTAADLVTKMITYNLDFFLSPSDSNLAILARSVHYMTQNKNAANNPYKIFKEFKTLEVEKSEVIAHYLHTKEESLDLISLYSQVEKKISYEQVIDFCRGFSINPLELKRFCEMIQLRIASLDEEKKNETLKYIHDSFAVDLDNLCKNFQDPFLLSLLQIDPELEISRFQLYFISLIRFIFSKSSILHSSQLITEQEEVFCSISSSIRNCQEGKKDGIVLAYNELDREYKITSHSYLQETSAVKKAKEIIYETLKKNILHQISSDTSLMKELVGTTGSISQLAHHTAYVKNLLSLYIGLDHEISFDLNTHLVSNSLIEKSFKTVIEIFLKHVNISSAKEWIKKAFLQSSKEDGLFMAYSEVLSYTLSNEEMWDVDVGFIPIALSDRGAYYLLKRLDLLKEAKKI